MPQDLRTPEQTPPSEEDLAEAERLKTEGERRQFCPNSVPWVPALLGETEMVKGSVESGH
jgi:hypothetical protein